MLQTMESVQASINEEVNDNAGSVERHQQINKSRNINNSSSTLPPPSQWLQRYNQLLDRYPLRAKMCTSFLVSAFGSALGSYSSATVARKHRNESSERAENQPICKGNKQSALSEINWIDVFSYAIHGALINTPICHFWYEWLSVHGPESNTASVLVDQLVVQPPLLACKFRYHLI